MSRIHVPPGQLVDNSQAEQDQHRPCLVATVEREREGRESYIHILAMVSITFLV